LRDGERALNDPQQFVGELMKCSLCDFEKLHAPGSGWVGGVIGIEGKPKHAYYLCPECISHVCAHPDPRDPSDMTADLDLSKGIEHKPNRDYALAFLATLGMKREVEMQRSGTKQ
jgi:hypothetical protein